MNFNPQKTVLDNGITKISLAMTPSQSVTAMLMVKVGSRYEEDRIAGISHFLEHMVFKGTKKYPNSFKLTTAIESVGAEFNAFTSKEYTGFYVKSAISYLDLALDILSQMVWFPLLPEKEMIREKGVIIEEINMREDMPMAKVGENFENLIYGNSLDEKKITSLGREVIGYKETVTSLQKKDFLHYLYHWYQPQRMVLGIIGGIDRVNHLSKMVDCYFNNHQHGRSLKNQTLKPLIFQQTKPQISIQTKETEQTHFCLGVRAYPKAHKNRYIMAVLSTLLAGNMSSRLFMEVREKRGLAYYIKSEINTYFDNGYFMVQAGVDPKKLEETIKVILAEFSQLTAKMVSKSELIRAKEYLKGKLALALEDSKEVASFFVEDYLLEAKIRRPKEIIAGLEKVTAGDINQVAKEIFVNNSLNLAFIGPNKNLDQLKRLLNL